ncbi:MAG: L,D-transpeptidase [Ramlibacter sp.]|nr:L,D-transpeptidase [Ramlibacter sp.]
MFKRPTTDPASPPSGRIFYTGLLAALFGFGLFFDHAATVAAPRADAVAALHADLARENASAQVLQVAQWAVESRDHTGLPFVVVDKAGARLFAFDALGRLRASAPVLLGSMRGDGPAAPATPAGRFVADGWMSNLGDGIVWVNGGTAVSLHSVSSAASPGHGSQRLASAAVEDKRISDGSLHVADEFYREYLGPLKSQASIAYVLPELQPARSMFTSNGFDSVATRNPS